MASAREAAIEHRLMLAERIVRAFLPTAASQIAGCKRQRWLQTVDRHWYWAYVLLRQRYLLQDAGYLNALGDPLLAASPEVSIWMETRRLAGPLADQLHVLVAALIRMRGLNRRGDIQNRAALRHDLVLLLERCGTTHCRPYDANHT